MRLRYPGISGWSKVSSPLAGTFEFTPECEIPDEFAELIKSLLADGYEKVEVKPKAKKEEPGKVVTPKEEEKPAEGNFACPKCGKSSTSAFGLQAHVRWCKK